MNTTAPLSDVRDNLREVVDRVVDTGDNYTITRYGRPVAMVMSIDEYESLIETLNILADSDAVRAISAGEAELDKSA